MGRKSVVIDNPPAVTDGLPSIEAMTEASSQLALLEAQRESTVRAVATLHGYQLPADSTDPDLIQRDIAANMRRTIESMIEVGRGLLVLKKACDHGQFVARLAVLNFDPRAAQRYMQVVRKFSNASTSTHLLKAANTQSKLLEMLVLDDEQIEELELTGQTGELKLDDVATMSVKELRAALRELRADAEAKDAVLDDAQKKLRALQMQAHKKKLEAPTPDEVEAKKVLAMQDAANMASALIGGALRQAIEAMRAYDEENGVSNAAVMSGFIARIEDATDALRVNFALPRLKDDADDPFGELPDDFLEKQGLVMPTPNAAR
ncbi:MAG: DUF3102 domain-containing protein [Desulfobulbus sp.]|nr:DUF3102 domain-containing protein [Desulfobulbus sp.]